MSAKKVFSQSELDEIAQEIKVIPLDEIERDAATQTVHDNPFLVLQEMSNVIEEYVDEHCGDERFIRGV